MATRIDNTVTLSHRDAEVVASLLQLYATDQQAHANRTKSAAIRASCQLSCDDARRLSHHIIASLWTWEG